VNLSFTGPIFFSSPFRCACALAYLPGLNR
jgi:hypothetical protein